MAQGQPRTFTILTAPGTSSVSAPEDGTVRVTTGGNTERWNAATNTYEAVDLGTTGAIAGGIEGAGPPAVRPANTTVSSTYWDNVNEDQYTWDVAEQVWRTSGLVARRATLATLPANTFTRIPSGGLTSVENFDVFQGSQEVTAFSRREAASDRWPEIASLTALNDLSFELIGSIRVAIP